jgi:hypothetical protein
MWLRKAEWRSADTKGCGGVGMNDMRKALGDRTMAAGRRARSENVAAWGAPPARKIRSDDVAALVGALILVASSIAS